MADKPITRKFSLGDDFMTYKTDDLLYGFMRSLSTARPIKEKGNITGWQEYLPKKDFMKNKKVIAGICGCTTRTINNHINDLFAAGLLDEGIEVVEILNKDGTTTEYEYPCYWFPINEANVYKIVERDLVKYLVDTRNAQAIKVYLYLLNKYEWKPGYLFTVKEVQKALGYSGESASARSTVSNILDSFAREGMIEIEDEVDYDMRGDEVIAIPKKRLNFVAKSVKQLRKLG